MPHSIPVIKGVFKYGHHRNIYCLRSLHHTYLQYWNLTRGLFNVCGSHMPHNIPVITGVIKIGLDTLSIYIVLQCCTVLVCNIKMWLGGYLRYVAHHMPHSITVTTDVLKYGLDTLGIYIVLESCNVLVCTTEFWLVSYFKVDVSPYAT